MTDLPADKVNKCSQIFYDNVLSLREVTYYSTTPTSVFAKTPLWVRCPAKAQAIKMMRSTF
jgi:hypothetical protein